MRTDHFSELREKQIINVSDGANLGRADDIEIDLDCAKVLSLMISGGGFFGVGKKNEIVIPWEKITCIGEDTILVDLETDYCRCHTSQKRGHKCFST